MLSNLLSIIKLENKCTKCDFTWESMQTKSINFQADKKIVLKFYTDNQM